MAYAEADEGLPALRMLLHSGPSFSSASITRCWHQLQMVRRPST